MSGTTVVTVADPEGTTEATAEAVTEAVEVTAEAVADAVVEVVEATTEAAEESGSGDAVEAVTVAAAINHEGRITELEGELAEARAQLAQVANDADYALWLAERNQAEVEEATTPAEVEAMVEATEVVEGEDGELHLDAPDEVPPTSEQHWLFADRRTLWQKISRALGLD